jgi:hypothetical protein
MFETQEEQFSWGQRFFEFQDLKFASTQQCVTGAKREVARLRKA